MSLTENRPNPEERYELIWKLSRSEISSIARETCKKVLHDENRSKVESFRLAESMLLLGDKWLEVSKL